MSTQYAAPRRQAFPPRGMPAALPAPPRSRLQRLAVLLTPNLSYAMVLLGVILGPFVTIRLRGSMQVADLFFLAAAVALGLEARSGKSRLWAPLWMVLAVAVMLLIYLLQAFAIDVGSLDDLVLMVIIAFDCVLIPVVVASQRLTSPAQLRLLIKCWLLANLAAGLLPLLQHEGVPLPFLDIFLMHVDSRMAGFTPHPNLLGFHEALTASVALAMALGARGLPGYLFWMACAAMALYVVNLTGSRTSLVTALAGSGFVVLMFTLLQPGRGNYARLFRSLVVPALAGLGYLFYKSFSGTGTALDRLFGGAHTATHSDYMRQMMLNLSMGRFWEHPLTGVGYRYFVEPHNVYVSSLACGGVFGLVFLILIFGGLGWYAFRLLRAAIRGKRDFTTAVAFVSVYGCCLMVGIKESFLIYRNPMVALGIMCLLFTSEFNRIQAAGPPAARGAGGRGAP